jgi:hypothetical protein
MVRVDPLVNRKGFKIRPKLKSVVSEVVTIYYKPIWKKELNSRISGKGKHALVMSSLM